MLLLETHLQSYVQQVEIQISQKKNADNHQKKKREKFPNMASNFDTEKLRVVSVSFVAN